MSKNTEEQIEKLIKDRCQYEYPNVEGSYVYMGDDLKRASEDIAKFITESNKAYGLELLERFCEYAGVKLVESWSSGNEWNLGKLKKDFITLDNFKSKLEEDGK